MKKKLSLFLTVCLVISLVPAFSLTALAVTRNETEPNNTTTQANTYNRTYNDYDNYGKISYSDDYDYWVVSFSNSGTANFWLGDSPTGCNYNLYLFNSSGTQLACSENNGTSTELISNHPVTGGVNYYILVRTANQNYNSATNYHMRTKQTSVSYSDQYEPYSNYMNGSTPSITINGSSIFANVYSQGDVDYYKVSVTANKTLLMHLTNVPSGCNYELALLNSSGTVVKSANDGGSGADEQINHQITTSGTYYIRVKSSNSTYSASNYTLTLSDGGNYTYQLFKGKLNSGVSSNYYYVGAGDGSNGGNNAINYEALAIAAVESWNNATSSPINFTKVNSSNVPLQFWLDTGSHPLGLVGISKFYKSNGTEVFPQDGAHVNWDRGQAILFEYKIDTYNGTKNKTDYAQEVFAHEMGHCLGLAHVFYLPDPYDNRIYLMYSEDNRSTMVPTTTEINAINAKY